MVRHMGVRMEFRTVAEFARARPVLPNGVVAVLLCESRLHAAASARRLAAQGAAAVVMVGDAPAVDLPCPAIRIAEEPGEGRAAALLNELFGALAGRWVLWLWNGEFFVFPFGETRRLSDLAQFLEDERRVSIYTYALDLYADDLPREAEPPENAPLCFDRLGYHAFPRPDRGLRLFGGLGWRFEELTPGHMHQIGRAALLKPRRGVEIGRDLIFDDPGYASVSAPWHHSPTAAIMTLRRAWRIFAHPQFPEWRGSLHWHGTTRWDWSSRQLLELGMIEPGQWF